MRGVQNGGTHVYPWLIHVDVWQKPSQYCNYPPIKIKQLIKIIKVVERIVFLLCTSEIDTVLMLCAGKRNLSNAF